LPLPLAVAILRIVLRAAYPQKAHGNEEEKQKQNKKEKCRRVIAAQFIAVGLKISSALTGTVRWQVCDNQ
jgi:hypothetical protein